MSKQPIVPPFDKKVRLKDYDPGYTGGFESEDEIRDQMVADLEKMEDLQERLYAEGKRSMLIVVQGIDTGGKDGVIKHVFRGLDPQGVRVTSFKAPSAEELSHDFLWRIHQHTPRKGMINVFNRSHYEDVLVVRVHDLVPKKAWKQRYGQINEFEQLLAENGTTILKFFLYISRDEQKRRLEDRRDDPKKQWKFNVGDLKERALWDDYMEAYEDMRSRCHSESAPWHVIPANRKWYRNYIVARTIVATLEAMDPKFPKPTEDYSQVVIPD